jgi:hypothetical protein
MWQNTLTKLLGFIGHASKVTRPFEAWKRLITDETSDNILKHTNQYILTTHPNFLREIDAILTEKN